MLTFLSFHVTSFQKISLAIAAEYRLYIFEILNSRDNGKIHEAATYWDAT